MEGIKSRKIRALLAGGLVLGLGATVTLALWTDQVDVTGDFGAGGFVLEAGVGGSDWSDSAVAAFTASGDQIEPEKVYYKEVHIRVKADNALPNGTDVELSAAITGATSPEGAFENNAHMTYAIYDVSDAAACTAEGVGAKAAVWSGTNLTDNITPAATLPKSTVTTKGNVGSSVELCFVVTAKSQAGGLLALKGASTVWTFTGTQQATP